MRRQLWIMAFLGVFGWAVAGIGSAAAGQDPPLCNGLRATIWGDDGNNRIIGTDGRDVIHGGDGRDRIFGGGGRDVICGGPGSDLIKGQKGADELFGGDGRDRLIGGQGADVIDGGRGNDRLSGGFGDDTLVSAGGRDSVLGGAGIDSCDFDKKDAYTTCEAGDVAGLAGFGNATVAIDVPAGFAVNELNGADGRIEAYVLDLYVTSSDGEFREITVSVLDAFGEERFVTDPVANAYTERVLVFGENLATIAVSGLEPTDFWDIAFITHHNLPVFDPATTTVFSNGSAVFKWKPAVPEGTTGTIDLQPQIPGANVQLYTMAPGEPGVVEVFLTDLDEPRTLTAPATPGATIYAIRAWQVNWQLTLGAQ